LPDTTSAEHTTAPVRQAEVVVCGAGIAGLAAAHALRDLDVVVLEADGRVGGRLRSERRDGVWLNLGGHVFAGTGSASDRLISAAGVQAVPVPGRLAAIELGGRVVASGRVETFPLRLPLSLMSRVALVRAGARLRIAVARYAALAAPVPGEPDATRQERMLGFMDDRSFSEFVGPLPADVDGLFRATLTRSSGEPEELQAGYGVGYFHLVWDRSGGLSRNILGGSATLTDALAAPLGDRVRLGARVSSVEQDATGVTVTYSDADGNQRVRAQAAVVATPAYVTTQIVNGLPDDTTGALRAIPYGPYVVGAFLTRETRQMPWDAIYALATPRRSFNMLFNTANVLRRPGEPRAAGGSLMVYAAADLGRALLTERDEDIRSRFRADLEDMFPEARRIIDEIVIHRWERGIPFPRPGRALLQSALTRPLGRVHLAGDYLGTWYTETAAQTAELAAGAARSQVARDR
jgi:protoporphyrinogen/coproporphyrinogen III oxidase